MARFMTAAKKFVKGEVGATMAEYALMIALIAVVCVAAVTALGLAANTQFTAGAAGINSAS